MTLGLSISSVSEVCGALVWREVIEQVADAPPRILDGAFGSFAHEVFEFDEDLLDWVQIGRVWRQEQKFCAGAADCLAHRQALVAAEIVEDDDVTRLEDRQQELIYIGGEALAIDGAVKHARGIDPVAPQCRQERHRAPVAIGSFGAKPPPFCTPSPQRRHVGLGPGFVNEHQPRRIKTALILLPARPVMGDVRPVLLAWQDAFF